MLLLLQVAATWAMTGIVWFVQLVQYPSFARVDVDFFARTALYAVPACFLSTHPPFRAFFRARSIWPDV